MERIRFKVDKSLLNIQKQLRFALFFLSFILVLGTLGYHFLEKWTLLDSLYMTVISITTTGFREVFPLTPVGKVFTLFIIITGFSAVAYTAARGAQYFFEQGLFWRRKMKKKIVRLKNHTIVCGFGRMGKEICRMLQMNKSPFIVIEQEETAINELKLMDYPFLEEDANEDETLVMAGIERAQAVITVLSSDADNVFTVLTARGLNPGLRILARAVSESSEKKLLKAGADKVILPYLIGGRRIALSLLKPEIMDFIDLIATDTNIDIRLEQVKLSRKSELVGLELGKTFIRADLDVIVVMIVRSDDTVIYNPKSNTQLMIGDKLLAIGHPDSLVVLGEIAEN